MPKKILLDHTSHVVSKMNNVCSGTFTGSRTCMDLLVHKLDLSPPKVRISHKKLRSGLELVPHHTLRGRN